MTPQEKLLKLNQDRRDFREKVLAEFKITGNPLLSELIRKIDRDILFWESQTDHSIQGLVKTLEASLKLEDDE